MNLWSEEEQWQWDAAARIGALSSVITRLGKIASGATPTRQDTLVLAQAYGRDYFAEIRAKRAAHVRERAELAEELQASGFRMRKLAEYRAALRELEG